MQSFYRSLFLSFLCILLAAAPVQAGALWLYEEATPDMARTRVMTRVSRGELGSPVN